MQNPRKRSLQEHLAAIGAAIVLVAGVGVAINQSGMLRADILQGGVAAASQGDISYTTTNNSLIVRSQKLFANSQSLSFQIVYNHDDVQPSVSTISTPFDYTSSSGTDGVIHVTIFVSGDIEKGTSLVTIPFSGNIEEITISDATMLFSGSTMDRLAIKKL